LIFYLLTNPSILLLQLTAKIFYTLLIMIAITTEYIIVHDI